MQRTILQCTATTLQCLLFYFFLVFVILVSCRCRAFRALSLSYLVVAVLRLLVPAFVLSFSFRPCRAFFIRQFSKFLLSLQCLSCLLGILVSFLSLLKFLSPVLSVCRVVLYWNSPSLFLAFFSLSF